MPSYTFKNDIPSIQFVINDLSHNTNLSEWEKGFIKSVKEYSDKGGFLSAKQLGTLSNLWGKY